MTRNLRRGEGGIETLLANNIPDEDNSILSCFPLQLHKLLAVALFMDKFALDMKFK